MNDAIAVLEQLAQYGTAPEHGCTLFSVGFREPIDRLKRTIFENRFERGGSDVRFVVGPYGSGKTHFLRHLQDIAEQDACVTAEVALNLDVDFTKPVIVFREVARQIRAPGGTRRGLDNLLRSMLGRVQGAGEDPGLGSELLRLWLNELDLLDIALPEYPRMVKRALTALDDGDLTEYQNSVRWLEGGMSDPALAKMLGVTRVTSAEESLWAHQAMIALFQIIRHSGYRGTVVAFDEADQGFTVDSKRVQRILSMLQSTINAFATERGAAALLVFALTPDVVENMEKYPALQQRIADPGPGYRFFEGNTRAVRIDLRDRNEDADLLEIGRRLVDLLFNEAEEELNVSRQDVHVQIEALAREVMREDISSANRRTLVKRAATRLLQIWDPDAVDHRDQSEPEDEV